MLPSTDVYRSPRRNLRGTGGHDFWRSIRTLKAAPTEERKRKTSDTDDRDVLIHEERTASGEGVITPILSHNQAWRRTRAHNPGFDLSKAAECQTFGRCEAKAVEGGPQDRFVGLSRTRFERTRVHGADYRLYAVERAGREGARIGRIQDFAGKAKAFTLDKGWLDVAELD